MSSLTAHAVRNPELWAMARPPYTGGVTSQESKRAAEKLKLINF